MAFTGRTKFSWDGETVKRLVGEAAAKALQNAGMDVRKSTQRMMSNRKPLSVPRFWVVGERDGIPMVAVVRQIPKPDKVTSWKTGGVYPKGFLRQDIQTDFDNATQSVVIGPSKAPWLNQLHEFGGTVPLYFLSSNTPRREYQGRRLPNSLIGNTGAYVGILRNTANRGSISLGTRTVRGRAYMEIGLQASIHRIPPQFQDTLRRSGGSIG